MTYEMYGVHVCMNNLFDMMYLFYQYYFQGDRTKENSFCNIKGKILQLMHILVQAKYLSLELLCGNINFKF